MIVLIGDHSWAHRMLFKYKKSVPLPPPSPPHAATTLTQHTHHHPHHVTISSDFIVKQMRVRMFKCTWSWAAYHSRSPSQGSVGSATV